MNSVKVLNDELEKKAMEDKITIVVMRKSLQKEELKVRELQENRKLLIHNNDELVLSFTTIAKSSSLALSTLLQTLSFQHLDLAFYVKKFELEKSKREVEKWKQQKGFCVRLEREGIEWTIDSEGR